MEFIRLSNIAGTAGKAFVVVGMAAWGAQAQAVEPRLYQLGDGGAVAPHVALEFGSDDNVLRRNEGSDASTYFRLEPSVRYVVRQRNNRLQLSYRGDYYFDTEDYCLEPRDADCPNGSPQYNKASYQDHFFTADGFLEITRKVRATAFLEQGIVNQPLGTGLSANSGTLSTLVQPDSFNRSLLRAQLSYGAPQARGEIRAGVSFTNKKFNDDDANPGRNFEALNERSVAPSATLLYRLGNKTQVFAGLSRSEVRGGNSERDITSQFVGFEIDASSITSGSFQLNNVRENFLGTRGDLDYVGWEAEVSWKPRRYSTVKFSGGRETSRGVFNLDDPSLSTVIGQDIGITTDLGINWQHFWRDRFSTAVTLNWSKNEDVGPTGASGVDSNDVTTSIRLQGDYNLRRWLDVGAFILTDNREGNGLDRDYQRTVLGITTNGTF